jgi:hypothetical protein
MMKISKIHWLLRFFIGMAIGLIFGYFTDINLGVIIGIILGTAFAKGTWKV